MSINHLKKLGMVGGPKQTQASTMPVKGSRGFSNQHYQAAEDDDDMDLYDYGGKAKPTLTKPQQKTQQIPGRGQPLNRQLNPPSDDEFDDYNQDDDDDFLSYKGGKPSAKGAPKGKSNFTSNKVYDGIGRQSL